MEVKRLSKRYQAAEKGESNSGIAVEQEEYVRYLEEAQPVTSQAPNILSAQTEIGTSEPLAKDRSEEQRECVVLHRHSATTTDFLL